VLRGRQQFMNGLDEAAILITIPSVTRRDALQPKLTKVIQGRRGQQLKSLPDRKLPWHPLELEPIRPCTVDPHKWEEHAVSLHQCQNCGRHVICEHQQKCATFLSCGRVVE
jgi:hypothetical protein